MNVIYQHQQQQIILQLIEDCNNEQNLHKRIEILYRINSLLPIQHQLKIPSLITNAYINTALYRIEQTSVNYEWTTRTKRTKRKTTAILKNYRKSLLFFSKIWVTVSYWIYALTAQYWNKSNKSITIIISTVFNVC